MVLTPVVVEVVLETVSPCCRCCLRLSVAEHLGSSEREGVGQWPHSCRACDPWIHNRWTVQTTEWWFGLGRIDRKKSTLMKLRKWWMLDDRGATDQLYVIVAMDVVGRTSCGGGAVSRWSQ